MAKDKKSTMGSDLDSYARRKIAEIDEPRYEKIRKDGKYIKPTLKEDLKKIPYAAMGAYGVGPATVVDGGINALNAAGDAVSKAKKEVGSRLGKGIPKAVEAVGKAGTEVKSAGARGLKEIKSAAQQFLKKDLSAKKPVRTKDAESAASKDTEKKAKGGSVGSASRRADGCAIRGKTRGRMS